MFIFGWARLCSGRGPFSSCGVCSSHCDSFSYCKRVLALAGFGSFGSWALRHRLISVAWRLSFSQTRRIFQYQGSNPCLLNWKVNSAPLSHQGSPVISFFYHLCLLGGEGNGNPLQYSCLEYSVDRGGWWAAVHRAAQSPTWLKWRSMHACLLGPQTAPQLITIFFKTHFKFNSLLRGLQYLVVLTLSSCTS